MKLLFIATMLFLFSCESKPIKALPYIGNYDLEYKDVNGRKFVDTVYPKMVPFKFLNQDSIKVNNKTYKNKVWISDFFFTSCPTICPTMTTQMKRLEVKLRDLSDHIQFLSFSIDPKRDHASRLTAYRNKYGISAKNWDMLTGDEKKTHLLGIENFQLFAGKDPKSAGGYAHSPAFTLVDKEGYVRGVYVGTETEDVDRMAEDVRKLLEQEYGIIGSK
jgi:protein SCO1/2